MSPSRKKPTSFAVIGSAGLDRDSRERSARDPQDMAESNGLTPSHTTVGSSPGPKGGAMPPRPQKIPIIFHISALTSDFSSVFSVPFHNSLSTQRCYRLCRSAKYTTRSTRISPANEHLYTHLQHSANPRQKDKCSVYVSGSVHSSGSEQGIAPRHL